MFQPGQLSNLIVKMLNVSVRIIGRFFEFFNSKLVSGSQSDSEIHVSKPSRYKFIDYTLPRFPDSRRARIHFGRSPRARLICSRASSRSIMPRAKTFLAAWPPPVPGREESHLHLTPLLWPIDPARTLKIQRPLNQQVEQSGPTSSLPQAH